MATDVNWKWREAAGESGCSCVSKKPQRITEFVFEQNIHGHRKYGRHEILNRGWRKCSRKKIVFRASLMRFFAHLPALYHSYCYFCWWWCCCRTQILRNFEWHIEKLSVFFSFFFSFIRTVVRFDCSFHFVGKCVFGNVSYFIWVHFAWVCVCGLVDRF